MNPPRHASTRTTLTSLLLAATAALLLSSAATTTTHAASPTEYVICSGGPSLFRWENLRIEDHRHDRWWGNFVRTARIRMQQLRAAPGGDSLDITWLVYRDAYVKRGAEEGRSLIDLIHSVRDAYNVNLVWFNSGQDVIDYLNRGRDRRHHKLSGFEYYGHSNKYAFMFDYSCDIAGASSAYLHENHLDQLRRGLFTKNAHVQSYGCHTGESMSKLWKKATGTTMVGAVGKTDYSLSWQGTLPHINKGYWKR